MDPGRVNRSGDPGRSGVSSVTPAVTTEHTVYSQPQWVRLHCWICSRLAAIVIAAKSTSVLRFRYNDHLIVAGADHDPPVEERLRSQDSPLTDQAERFQDQPSYYLFSKAARRARISVSSVCICWTAAARATAWFLTCCSWDCFSSNPLGHARLYAAPGRRSAEF